MELAFIEEVHSFSTGRFLILAEVQTLKGKGVRSSVDLSILIYSISSHVQASENKIPICRYHVISRARLEQKASL